ncbi:hypothetical protein HPB47_015134 [Ixodes persulcatus]|uniref:Uncharacterized protein n=1 Tax=Ixodes persulcatus TaxID=34615 RepID=A0AC60R3H5_IXOPE|nr:hypothetical protein HPB47_015134 [Ixodes persulcatus]
MDDSESSSEASEDTTFVLQDDDVTDHKQKKYIVFHNSLMRLLQRCLRCGATNCEVRLSFAGSFMRATITCPKQHKEVWCSQPLVEGKALGNILFCSAILFSGSSPTKVIRLLSLMGVKTLQKTQFFKFQRCYLLPAVQESTEVSSSNRMEKEGLARAFSSFESKNVKVDMLVTDRHREVNAYVRDNHPDVLHRFDAWHFAKGTETFRRLESVLVPAHLLKDIPRISHKQQTYALESFHALLIHYAPKSTKFTYAGMLARTRVAALHYNFNADRATLKTADGHPRFSQRCSKGDKQWTVIPVKEAAAYGYVGKLIDAVLTCVARWPTYELAEQAVPHVVHETLRARCGPRPDKEEAVRRHRSRFAL